ncbi:phosphomannomutase/phosphoglucomutase [Phenylobacterium sp.]|jgi:phosphomannomutase|uniref:phosphomannomutase/phosphoglucomutase n=1 Tax=Phenylobacterium sp. TaxID=1871053 RepID=UPI002E2F9B39|nr:phosphomannomutase/phosphoglucomutase [Phenylobacterium sp.]HEX2558785.1 phosphomannomutase/phosphoglucomutase [Phenylobacterium sp.]
MSLVEHAPESGRPSPAGQRKIHPRAVRAYDIRGRVGEEIDADGAYGLGRSYAAAAKAAGLSRIAVGRDGRISSPSLEQALVWGLCDGGMKVERVGLCPTPMVSFAVRRLGLDGAVMVTASHNPPAENGFKILLGDDRVHGPGLKALVETPAGTERPGYARRTDVGEAYVESLAAAAEGMADLSVVWDCGNGATGEIVQRLAARLPGRHRLLNETIDGRFPAHHPDPAVAANLDQLAQAVTAHGCDLGVAFDGDGDRLGVVGPDGRVLWADQLLLLLARDLLTERPGAAIVGDVKCSRILFEGVAQAGGRPVLAPSGYVLVREAMLREDAALAGELSGHIFYDAGWGVVDDALYAAIRTFLAVSRLPGGLPAFRESLPPTFATPELRIPCEEARKPQVVREVAERMAGQGGVFDEELGLRVSGPDGWWLLRPSGTEPKLTCRCEAAHPDALERLKAQLAAELKASGVEAEF